MSIIKKIIAGGMTLLIMGQLCFAKPNMAYAGQEKQDKKVELGYNALECAVIQDFDMRYRLLSNIRLNLKPVFIGYHGLNEVNLLSLPTESYCFGRNTVFVGHGNTAAALVTKVNQDGLADVKAGIRQFYKGGWTDLTFDKGAANLTMYLTSAHGKWLLELMHAIEQPYNGKAGHYTELQLNKKIANKAYVFLRGEFNNLKPATGMIGVTKQF